MLHSIRREVHIISITINPKIFYTIITKRRKTKKRKIVEEHKHKIANKKQINNRKT